MNTQTDANQRIIRTARDLFIAQGFRKTSMAEVAHGAGVSRVTIYRYYSDKKDLVRTVIMQAADVFMRINESAGEGAAQNPLAIIDLFQSGLGNLSSASLLGAFDELHRIYPDIYDEYRAIRKHALDGIFDQALAMLKRGNMLRKDINETVLRHLFFDAIVNAVENPDFSGLNIPRDEILGTIREVFLHGIIDTRAGGGKGSTQDAKTRGRRNA